jgi:hypothetical protein
MDNQRREQQSKEKREKTKPKGEGGAQSKGGSTND